ncbi:MAG TPA: EamA family transporter [Nitrososphaerales archaeon]|nr:EamA family transporter [Nitrososphaerales archaeon]
MYVSLATGLTAAFCWGTADYMSRGQSERVGYYRTIIYSQLVTLITVVVLVPAVSPALTLPLYPVLALLGAGVVNFVAFIFLYRAFHRGVVSVVAPVVYSYPAVTAVLAVAVLGASLSLVQGVVIAVIVAGVILLSTRFSELYLYFRGSGAPGLTKGVGLAVGASLCFGVAYIGIGYAAPFVSFVLPVLLLRIIAISAGIILAPVLKQEVRPSRLVFSRAMIAIGVLEAFGFLAFTYGVSASGSALPIVASLSGMGGAVAATYGLAFLRERLEPNQVLGVLLSLAGVFALLYLGG